MNRAAAGSMRWYEACAAAVGDEGCSVNRLRPIARAWLTLPCRRMPRVTSCRSLRWTVDAVQIAGLSGVAAGGIPTG